MSLNYGGETFVDVYAPSDTANKKERMELFNELATHLFTMGRNKLPVMAGDWNVILADCDATIIFRTKYCKVLDRIVKSLDYKDCFRFLVAGIPDVTELRPLPR